LFDLRRVQYATEMIETVEERPYTVLTFERIKRGLSMSELAEAIGVARSTISNLERRLKRPHRATLRVLEDFFKRPAADLLADAQEDDIPDD
jgi:transcriptional regulator with XRE-family HTH domain